MRERRTIGLLINDIDGNYQTYLWLMIKKAAEKLDCNLIVYQGRSLGRKEDADAQHHIIYDFASRGNLDGIVITGGSVANYITHEEFALFCKRYSQIPFVSIGAVVPGQTSIIIDNKEGMKSLVAHLVKDHGYRRIAFVTGPKDNIDSNERFEAYVEVLAENGIKVDDDLVFHGDFVSETGYCIMKDVIQSGIEFDAIVYANDDMALGAVKCLKDLKKTSDMDLTRKYVICGFDDSINSSLTKPSLTTVRQPLEEVCQDALEMLLRKIDGEKLEEIIAFPSLLVKRESCRCLCTDKANMLSESYLRLVPNYKIHENVQTYSLDELYERITKSLRRCNIRSCFISRYQDGSFLYDHSLTYDGTFVLPKQSELIYAYYDNSRIDIKDNIKYFKTKDIVPSQFNPKDRRITYLVNPLFFNDEHFGFVVFEVQNDDVINFEPLRGQISNTMKGALMLLERDKMEECIRESERLASLGQLIGGISHNLMSPIMSMAGGYLELESLINEYQESIDDSTVTAEDHREIALEMAQWIKKLKQYNSFMSQAISTARKQAVLLNEETDNEFTIEELVSAINFLKENNVNIRKMNFKMFTDIDLNTRVKGGVSSLILILNNLINNSLQAYDKDTRNPAIDFHICKHENSVMFIVKDYGIGISDDVKNRLFKQMYTTKGKNGSGISLLLSYSTIKGKYGGDMWFESTEGQGTTFYITIPVFMGN